MNRIYEVISLIAYTLWKVEYNANSIDIYSLFLWYKYLVDMFILF